MRSTISGRDPSDINSFMHMNTSLDYNIFSGYPVWYLITFGNTCLLKVRMYILLVNSHLVWKV